MDPGVEPADDGEKLKAGHAGHVEVGEQDVGNGVADHAESGESVLSGADVEATRCEDLTQQGEGGDFVVDDEQIESGFGHDRFLRAVFWTLLSMLAGQEKKGCSIKNRSCRLERVLRTNQRSRSAERK
jgi:hypothetical protein